MLAGMSRPLVALALWIVFAIAFCPHPRDERQVWFGTDQALLLRSADAALAGDPPLVGAYSKGSLYHPGPLFLYVLAGVQALTRGDVALTNAVVSWCQAATLPILALFALRVTNSWLVALALPLLIVFDFAFLFYVRIIWNVAIVLPALSLALWLTWEAWEMPPRSAWLLPLLTAVLCFLGQAHLAYTPLAVALGIVVVVRCAIRGPASRWRWALLAAVVALVCWAPALWDAFRNHGGNVAALLEHFGRERQRHDLWTAWGTLQAIGWHGLPRLVPVVPMLIVTTILIASAFWRSDERARGVRALAVILAVAWTMLLISISRVPDAIDLYYLRPVTILFAVQFVGGAAGLLLWLRPRGLVRAVEVVMAVVVLAIVLPLAREEWVRFRTPAWNRYPLQEMRLVVRAVGLDLQRVGTRPAVRVEFEPPDLEGTSASIRYLLEHEGIGLTGDPDAPTYRVVIPPAGDAMPPAPDRRELVRTAKYRVERVDHGRPIAECPPMYPLCPFVPDQYIPRSTTTAGGTTPGVDCTMTSVENGMFWRAG